MYPIPVGNPGQGRFTWRHGAGGLLLALLATACKTTTPVVQQTPPQPVIVTLGNKAFTTDDFFQSFTKNQLSSDSAQHTDVKDYFDLYTTQKLKVLAAESEGRDTTEAFREEMNTYRKQLAQSYLTDKVLVESLAAEAYQRMQEDVNASHILVPVSEYATPADTLTAYRKALDLRQRAVGGDDFDQLARTNSGDPITAQNGGNLGYVTAFSVVYPLETAVYTTPAGGISPPVRTRYGYHLVRVNERRTSRGRVRVAHILVRMSPSADEAGQRAAQTRIDSAYARLQRGQGFEQVCRESSDDATSRMSGGVLPAFEPGRWVAAFEDAAFSLNNPGDYSKPVRTNYGWHIIKLLDRKGLDSYATVAPALQQRVKTDTRADVLRQATLQRLRREYTVQEDKAIVDQAVAKADSSLLRGQWRYTEPLEPALQQKILLTITPQTTRQPVTYTVNQFFDFVRQRMQPERSPTVTNSINSPPVANGSPAVAMRRLFDRFVGDQLMASEEANLDKKSPEFRALLSEIHDSVLLSQVMEQNVWERSLTDSLGQRQFYDQHQAQYQFPERAVATVIVANNDALLKQASELLAGRPPYQLRRSAPELTYASNQSALTPELRESLLEVLVAMSRNPDYVVEVSGAHEAAENDTVSASRVRNVVRYLQQSGIPLSRITEKDYQGTRPPSLSAGSSLRRVMFQYFSVSKADIARVLNARNPTTGEPAVTILEGIFAQGANPYLDAAGPWKTGTSTLRRDNKVVAVTVDRIEPARSMTFAEAQGAVINDYQATLEKQLVTQLRQKYPVKVNEDEIRKLTR